MLNLTNITLGCIPGKPCPVCQVCEPTPAILAYITPLCFIFFLLTLYSIWCYTSKQSDYKPLVITLIYGVSIGAWLCLGLALLVFG